MSCGMVPRRKRKRATNVQRTELREQRVAADADADADADVALIVDSTEEAVVALSEICGECVLGVVEEVLAEVDVVPVHVWPLSSHGYHKDTNGMEEAVRGLRRLTGNDVGDAGVDALADALRINATVHTLTLASNHVGDAGAEALADGT